MVSGVAARSAKEEGRTSRREIVKCSYKGV